MGLLSRRSNFVSKRKRNKKLTAENFWMKFTSPREKTPWRKDPICYTKQKLTTKQQTFAFYNICWTSLLSHQILFLPSPKKQTFALSNFYPNPLLFHPSIVQPIYCSNLLLFYISIVLFFYCIALLLFYRSIARWSLSYSSIVLHFCHFTRLHLLTVTPLYCPNTSMFHSSIFKQLGRLSKTNFFFSTHIVLTPLDPVPIHIPELNWIKNWRKQKRRYDRVGLR